MMTKKTSYIKPEMLVVDVMCGQQLLTGSITGGSVIEEPAGTDVPGMAPGFTDLENLINPLHQFGLPGL